MRDTAISNAEPKISASFGRTADFDSSAPYYGLHAGLGYRLNPDRHCGLEFYSTWYWTHLHSDERNILGDAFLFETLDSRRRRNGLHLSFDIPADGVVVKPFIGAAHEYVFFGIAEGSVHGPDLNEPGVRAGRMSISLCSVHFLQFVYEKT